MTADNTFTANSGRTWTWHGNHWRRDCDGMKAIALLHPDGLEGWDKDWPPEKRAALGKLVASRVQP